MDIPVDVKALVSNIADVSAAREIPLTVSVLLDEAAPADLIAFVRNAFASASPQARVSINYFSNAQALFDEKSDLVVVAAGITQEVGQIVAQVRAAHIPVMVVTTLPTVVVETAQLTGYPLLNADVIAPDIKDGDIVAFETPIVVRSQEYISSTGEVSSDTSFIDLEPYVIDDKVRDILHERMGEWVVAAFKEKRLAFAQAFPFVRKPLAHDAVKATSLENAGVGAVVFIPGADMPVMTANQMKMVLQIAAAYGQDLTVERAKELLAILAGGFALRSVARQVLSVVPVFGWAIKGGIGYAGTYTMGKAAIEYFEGGTNLAGVANVLSKSAGAVGGVLEDVGVAQSVSERVKERATSAIKSTAKKVYSQASDVVAQGPEQVIKTVAETSKTVVNFGKNVVNTNVVRTGAQDVDSSSNDATRYTTSAGE